MAAISAQTVVTALDGNDDLAVVDTSAAGTRRISWRDARTVSRWLRVETSRYTATPASTSTLTMSTSGDFKVGYPVKFTDGNGTYYAICTAVTASLLTIAGAPMDTASDLTDLWVGLPEMVLTVTHHVVGTYGDGVTTTLLATDENRYERWLHSTAYEVAFSATQKVVDTGAEAKINTLIAAARVSDADTNLGIQLGAAGAWVNNGAVAINATNYKVDRLDALELEVTAAGATGDGSDLTVQRIFVLEN